MEAYTDKRACARVFHTAAIEFSYFNKKRWYETQTLNYCDEGMCFKSKVSLQPGTTVFIRVKNNQPIGAGAGRGLRSVTLAEVKWCKEIINETEPFYVIGAKYYLPEY